MRQILTGGQIFSKDGFLRGDLVIEDGIVSEIGAGDASGGNPVVSKDNFIRCNGNPIDCRGLSILPGLVDVHVHLREPGFSFKETIASGTAAAAAGGVTAVCSMPNLDPAPDSPEHLEVQRAAIRKDARVRVVPFGCITKGQRGTGALADLEGMAPYVAGFSDDGRGVQEDALMEQAMRLAKRLDRPIVAHCEDNRLLCPGGCIHAGRYAAAHGLVGISSESEWRQVERDLKLAAKTGCRYHVCHVSTKESVALIRQAKRAGVAVSCDTAPHYLLLCEDDLADEGRFKMNPPLRSAADRDALLEGLCDGTIDLIATDHAPHTAEEKSRGLAGSLMGVVGLETAFPVLYTKLVRGGVLSLAALVEKMSLAPRRLFRLPGGLEKGKQADLAVFDLDREYIVDPERFYSMGRATPFAGWRVWGESRMTMVKGEVVWQRNTQER